MSAEARKNCRTQGKYNDKNFQYEDKKSRKSQEKRLKESPTEKETQERKSLKRKSDGTKEGTSFSSENNESFVEYQENSEYSFSQLEERKKPIEIKTPGKFVLSNTDNGESSVLFEPNFYTRDEAWELFDFLHDSTGWLDKNIIIHGIEYPQPRLVAWYGPLPYTYSGTTLKSADMPQCVLDIKSRVEDYLKDHNINVELNSVLLNLYRDNKDSVSWHSDDEFTMGVCPTIASVSLGDTRKFEMRPKSNRHYEDEHEKKGDEYFVNLSNGSLIIMDGCMQEDWQHRVPKEYHDKAPRINLTFRTVYEYEKGSSHSDSRVNNSKPVDQEILKNSNRVKIDLDEENFPPLSSVSNNVNSKSALRTYEKAESCQTKKINDIINNLDDEWTVETPPSIKTTRIIDKINASEEEWVVKTPVSRKVLFESSDAVSTSQGEITTKSPTSHRTFHKRNDIYGYVEEFVVETRPYQKISTKSNGCQCNANESNDLTIKSLSNDRDYPEKVNKVRNSKNTAVKKTFSDKAPPGKNNFSNESEDEWNVTSPVKNNSIKEDEWNITTPIENNSIKEDECNISSSVKNNSYSELGKINKSRKDWYDESCNSQTLSESDEINQSHEGRVEKSNDYPQQTSLKSNKNYRSHEDYFEKTHHRRTPLESNKTNQLRKERNEKDYQQQTSRESNRIDRSREDYLQKSYHRRVPLETNKVNKFHENRNMKSSFTRPNRFQSNKYEYYEERSAKPFNRKDAPLETNRNHRYNERGATEPFYNKNSSRREKNFQSEEKGSFESRNIERRTISNNERRCERIEFSNENIDSYEQRSDKNQNSDSKEKRNESSNFAVHSMRRHFSDIKNEPDSNRKDGWTPNIKAEEFIPGKMKNLPSKVNMRPSSVDTSTFGNFSLMELLNYDVDLMPSDELKNYASVLKLRVLDSISELEQSDKEELEVLCEITDGNQTDRNQKIICSRIYAIVKKIMPNEKWNCEINPRFPRYQDFN